MARLPRLIGRGRALEVLLTANDINGELAELYGYVNRSLPDAELDAFVDGLAQRIASFDKHAIAETKRLANIASLPPDSEIAPEWEAFTTSLSRPAARERIKKLMVQGFHQPGMSRQISERPWAGLALRHAAILALRTTLKRNFERRTIYVRKKQDLRECDPGQ